MGNCGQDIPFETQFLIVEARDGSHLGEDNAEQSALYVVFLPILEGDFRAVLQGNERNEMEICLESGKKSDSQMLFIFDVHIFRAKEICSIDPVQEILRLLGSKGAIWFSWQQDMTPLMSSQMPSSKFLLQLKILTSF